jgi:Ca-activated chloride channel family protein
MIQPTIEILPLKKGFLRAAAEASYALIRIVAPEAPATTETVTRTPLDIALVIDRSGSMSGQPLETAKECAVRIVKGLRPDDRISIVTFDDKIDVIQPLVAVGDAKDLETRLKQIRSGGSTDLFGGWEEGAKQLAPFVKKERVARVILLSDGQANQGIVNEIEIFKHVSQLAGTGITTSTIGLGHGFNESLLSGMAKHGEGVANFGQEPDDLNEAFEQQFAILSNTFLRQIELKIQGGSDVKARLVGEILEDKISSTRKLGTLSWNTSLIAVVEIKVGQNAKADELFAVSFKAQTKEGEAVKFSPKIFSLPEVDLTTYASLSPDINVAAAVSEAIVSEKLEHVENLLQRGKIKEAKELFAEIENRNDLTSWARQKVAYLKELLDNDMVMAMKEMRYGRSNFIRSARDRRVASLADVVDHISMASESVAHIQRKIIAGRNVRRQAPINPPPATPDANNGQA